MAFSLIKLAENTSDNIWKNYFELRKECVKQLNDYMPSDNWKTLKEISINSVKNGIGIYIVKNKTKNIGCFYFFKEAQSSTGTYILFQSKLINEVLNDELLHLIFNEFISFAPLSNSIAIRSINGEHDFISNKIKPKIICNRDLFKLNIKEAYTEIINSWLEESLNKFSTYNLKFYDELPDEILPEFCKVFQELLFDMPKNSELGNFNITIENERKRQEDGKKINHWAYRYLIFNEQNKLIGMTNVLVNKNNPKKISQFMTGIIKEYRGLGLSKWLKAVMFKKLTADLPELESIFTDTHPENHASRELSKKMGYKQTGTEKDILLSKENVLLFLHQNKNM